MARPLQVSLAPVSPDLGEIVDLEAEARPRINVATGEPRGPRWKVHDRTHIECGLDWEMVAGLPQTELEWDAYFFVPESLRIDPTTYEKTDIYTDLRAYVRLAVPESTFQELCRTPISDLRHALMAGEPKAAVYEMRFFACQVRAAAARARHEVMTGLGSDDDVTRARAFAAATCALDDVSRVMRELRDALSVAKDLPAPAPAAAEWVDEDVSRMVETLAGELALRLREVGAPAAIERAAIELAAGEARYRLSEGLSGVAWSGIEKRDVEHLEFRRHVLKRFTASALWLDPQHKNPSQWALHLLYAIAAGVAMAFAVAAALWNGLEADGGRLWMWCGMVVLAYMAKDRIKAWLQQVFSGVISKRFPDRRWVVTEENGPRVLSHADERVDFVPFDEVPREVLDVRRQTRMHVLEEGARPESVLWHHKDVTIHNDVVASIDERVDAMREILRLDLRNWLAHTDDPKRRIVFADPQSGEVCSAMAPRVYNIGIVYRLRRKGETSAEWHRVRVVVTRKGIRRIDRIS